VPVVLSHVARRIWGSVTMPASARRVSLTRNLLVPGWILIFGCLLMSVQPIGAFECVLWCLVGLVAVPALVLLAARA
jgi:hypothetical protein